MQAEIIACMQGAQAALEAGASKVIIETDAMEVVKAVYSDEYDLSAMTHLVAELRSLLVMNFHEWRITHRCRTANSAAHSLAALGSCCSLDDDPRLDIIPPCIQSVIAKDLALSE